MTLKYFLVSPDAAVVAATDQVESMLIHRQTGDTVQVRHHAVNHGPRVVVIESDVSIFVTSYR